MCCVVQKNGGSKGIWPRSLAKILLAVLYMKRGKKPHLKQPSVACLAQGLAVAEARGSEDLAERPDEHVVDTARPVCARHQSVLA